MIVLKYFLKKFIFLFSNDSLNWSKVTVKTCIMLQKISILIKCCSYELFIHLLILNNKMYNGFHKKILCSITVFNIDNNQTCFLSSKSSYYNDFWRSCDTEDWSNDDENTDLSTEINYILLYISHFYHFYCIFCIWIIFLSKLFSLIWERIVLKERSTDIYKMRNVLSKSQFVTLNHFIGAYLSKSLLLIKISKVQ